MLYCRISQPYQRCEITVYHHIAWFSRFLPDVAPILKGVVVIMN